MIPYERQEKILELVQDKKLVKIDELQAVFKGVSASTLRRDLKELGNKNRIEYLSGGAIKLLSTVGEIPISTRNTLNNKQKEMIADLAALQIEDGDVIYLDSGSTCSALFKRILSKKITIYTTNTDIFSIRGEIEAEIIILGGQFNPINSSVSGTLTEKNLQDIYFRKAFLGVNGIDGKYGVTTPTLIEATKKRLVKEHSDQVFLLCDSSKFHQLSNVRAFELANVTVISDQFDGQLSELVPVLTN